MPVSGLFSFGVISAGGIGGIRTGSSQSGHTGCSTSRTYSESLQTHFLHITGMDASLCFLVYLRAILLIIPPIFLFCFLHYFRFILYWDSGLR